MTTHDGAAGGVGCLLRRGEHRGGDGARGGRPGTGPRGEAFPTGREGLGPASAVGRRSRPADHRRVSPGDAWPRVRPDGPGTPAPDRIPSPGRVQSSPNPRPDQAPDRTGPRPPPRLWRTRFEAEQAATIWRALPFTARADDRSFTTMVTDPPPAEITWQGQGCLAHFNAHRVIYSRRLPPAEPSDQGNPRQLRRGSGPQPHADLRVCVRQRTLLRAGLRAGARQRRRPATGERGVGGRIGHADADPAAAACSGPGQGVTVSGCAGQAACSSSVTVTVRPRARRPRMWLRIFLSRLMRVACQSGPRSR